MTLYIYAGIAIAILFLVGSIIKWWNLPKTIEERRLAQESRAKAQDERREDRLKRELSRREAREKARADRLAARKRDKIQK
jgi:hypothetical protein